MPIRNASYLISKEMGGKFMVFCQDGHEKKRIKTKTVIFVVTKINCDQNLKNLVSVSITDKKKI